MSTKELLKLLIEIRENEKKAMKLYSRFIAKVKNEKLKQILTNIRDQEKKHISLSSEAISIIKHGSKYPRILEKLKDFSVNKICIVICSVGSYMETNLTLLEHLINQKGFRCIYLTVNKPAAYIKNLYGLEGIDTAAISFIECSTIETNHNEALIVSPENLTSIGMVIAKLAKQHAEKTFVYFDSISSLYIFHPGRNVERFIHGLAYRLRSMPLGLVMIVIKEEIDERSRAVLSTFSDIIIKA